MYFSFNNPTFKTPILQDYINRSIDKYIKQTMYSNDLIKKRILLNNIIYNTDSVIINDQLITHKPKFFNLFNLIMILSIGVSLFIKNK